MFDVVLNYRFLNFKFYLKKNNVYVFIKLYEFFQYTRAKKVE